MLMTFEIYFAHHLRHIIYFFNFIANFTKKEQINS